MKIGSLKKKLLGSFTKKKNVELYYYSTPLMFCILGKIDEQLLCESRFLM